VSDIGRGVTVTHDFDGALNYVPCSLSAFSGLFASVRNRFATSLFEISIPCLHCQICFNSQRYVHIPRLNRLLPLTNMDADTDLISSWVLDDNLYADRTELYAPSAGKARQ